MAKSDLLRTKYLVPGRHPGHIERPRLTDRLAAGRRQGHCLALISAPPGYGKSALLSEWIGVQDLPVAWLSLDADDNGPAIFWSHIAGAIGLVSPQFCTSILPYLNATSHPYSKTVATLLLNTFPLQQGILTLVLDDFHHITNADILAGFELLLNHCPEQLMLVIRTRADPALPVARLRAQGKLTELRAQDLALQLDETIEFISSQVRVNLANEDMDAEQIASNVPGIRIEALNTGHLIGVEAPDEVDELLAEFLAP